jgi:murein DD-endopeptidase MepM/ murein hydrolase activator NlpD
MARPQHEAPRTPGQRPSEGAGRRASLLVVLAVVAGGLALAASLWLPPSTAQQIPQPSAVRSPAAAALGGGTVPSPAGPSGVAATPVGSPTPAAATSLPARTPRATSSAAATQSPAPTPGPTRHPDAAPSSAAEFDLEDQVIAMGFPLKPSDRYRYRDNFGDAREGHAEDYNHARVRRKGELLRAHDGIDIYADRGTPVVAPFDGVVIDPSRRWDPWIRERYGKTAAIRSGEALTEGYIALLTHLEAVYVEPGQRVHRGEVVGTVGDSGNAEGGRPHLHFELRAPFLLSWQQAGEDRSVDAFNPYPSLRAADPKSSD